MLADAPRRAVPLQLATEVSLNGMCSLATEAWVRGENFMQELPIVAM